MGAKCKSLKAVAKSRLAPDDDGDDDADGMIQQSLWLSRLVTGCWLLYAGIYASTRTDLAPTQVAFVHVKKIVLRYINEYTFNKE